MLLEFTLICIVVSSTYSWFILTTLSST